MAGTQISNLFLKIHGIETRIHNGEKIVSSVSGAGKTEKLHGGKNEIRAISNSIHKNKLKMD